MTSQDQITEGLYEFIYRSLHHRTTSLRVVGVYLPLLTITHQFDKFVDCRHCDNGNTRLQGF